MARTSHNHRLDLPPLELECMNALWSLGEGTVQAVRARLFPARPLAYTTVMTVMDRLARKGIVEREKKGRAHVFRPAVSEEIVRHQAVERLLREHFRGSRESLRRLLDGIPADPPVFAEANLPAPPISFARRGKPAKKLRAPATKAGIDTSLL